MKSFKFLFIFIISFYLGNEISSVCGQWDPYVYLNVVWKQVDATLKENSSPTRYPTNTERHSNNYWYWVTTDASGWTSGFFPSLLWLRANFSGNSKDVDIATRWTEGILPEENNTQTHDVGFMVFYSFGRGYEVTGDESYKQVALKAAESLATRYSPIVGCIRSWNGPNFKVIIDNMMNLELLWWASQNGGSEKYFEMAMNHSDHMIRDAIKQNGSSYHEIDYDEKTGKVLSQSNTPQGLPFGVWARGQAWAIYGFTIAYRYSRYPRYLQMAQNVSDYFIGHLPSDFVPYWDFFAPHNESRDTSAASIAASGLLELSTYLTGSLAEKYWNQGINILKSLAYYYIADPKYTPAVLLEGTIGDNVGNVSLIYGDYYFTEALLKNIYLGKF